MCIRDRAEIRKLNVEAGIPIDNVLRDEGWTDADLAELDACLLYTSDAADERSSVDLGGRRIIKKKKRTERRWRCVL